MTSIAACWREHWMSATTMSAFARPMTTRGLSISKIRPESGPEMHASERRWSVGRWSDRAGFLRAPVTGTRSVVPAASGLPIGPVPSGASDVTGTAMRAGAPGKPASGLLCLRALENAVSSRENSSGDGPAAERAGEAAGTDDTAGLRISKTVVHFVHLIFFTDEPPKRDSS